MQQEELQHRSKSPLHLLVCVCERVRGDCSTCLKHLVCVCGRERESERHGTSLFCLLASVWRSLSLSLTQKQDTGEQVTQQKGPVSLWSLNICVYERRKDVSSGGERVWVGMFVYVCVYTDAGKMSAEAEKYKTLGNTAFGEKKYHEALEAW